MSANKHRSRDRRRRLLAEAECDPLRVNCRGGIGSGNADLAILVRTGMLRLARYRHAEGDRQPAPKRFRSSGATCGPVIAPTTRAVITDAGRAFLAGGPERAVTGPKAVPARFR